jgi:hypothetical protein
VEGEVNKSSSEIVLTLKNQSDFNWRLGYGPFPLAIGVNYLRSNGDVVLFDDGFRHKADLRIARGESVDIRIPLSSFPASKLAILNGARIARFALVQDGNAWFGSVSCKLPI